MSSPTYLLTYMQIHQKQSHAERPEYSVSVSKNIKQESIFAVCGRSFTAKLTGHNNTYGSELDVSVIN